jgi:hypothetical protein
VVAAIYHHSFEFRVSRTMAVRLCLLSFFALLLNMNSSTGTSSHTAAFAAPSQPQQSPGLNTEVPSGPSEAAADKIPQLPEADPNSKLRSIKLGETISFEEMGPVIINTDGTTRRIDNWDELTEHEKEVSWRRISKRNEQRRKVLLEKQQEDEASDSKEL